VTSVSDDDTTDDVSRRIYDTDDDDDDFISWLPFLNVNMPSSSIVIPLHAGYNCSPADTASSSVWNDNGDDVDDDLKLLMLVLLSSLDVVIVERSESLMTPCNEKPLNGP
jgi:hypothetical protein